MISVLIVDDEALTLELHTAFVERLDGFRVTAVAAGARAALSALSRGGTAEPIDLVLLDMTMADGTGLDVLRRVRASGSTVGVIAITAVRDATVVRQMVALGVAGYLVKPFTFAMFQDRMLQFREFRDRAREAEGQATQAEIDALIGTLHPTGAVRVPKGLSAETLARVSDDVRENGPVSARETAGRLGVSRVAVRRYLEYLVDAGRADRRPRYGSPGRPESEYTWRA